MRNALARDLKPAVLRRRPRGETADSNAAKRAPRLGGPAPRVTRRRHHPRRRGLSGTCGAALGESRPPRSPASAFYGRRTFLVCRGARPAACPGMVGGCADRQPCGSGIPASDTGEVLVSSRLLVRSRDFGGLVRMVGSRSHAGGTGQVAVSLRIMMEGFGGTASRFGTRPCQRSHTRCASDGGCVRCASYCQRFIGADGARVRRQMS